MCDPTRPVLPMTAAVDVMVNGFFCSFGILILVLSNNYTRVINYVGRSCGSFEKGLLICTGS